MEKQTEYEDATEALEPPAADVVTQRLEQWAKEARRESGADALRNLDAVETVLDLTRAHPVGNAQLYSGRRTKLSSLLRNKEGLAAARVLAAKIDAEKKASLSRYGLYPTYLVVGVASWTQLPSMHEESGDGKGSAQHFKLQHFNLPVLLRPLAFESEEKDYTLRMEGSVVLNPALIQAFTSWNIEFNAESLLQEYLGGEGFTVSSVLGELRHLGQDRIPGFDLRENILIANLGLSSTLLSADWERIIPTARDNPLVRAFAGETAASESLKTALPETLNTDRDPDDERGVGDLDVSQANVVETVASGRSVFVEVPPGSPGTQTVTAILADCAATGRQVCYVPGVRRIGNSVLNQLKQANLGAFVLDLTGDGEWRTTLRKQMTETVSAAVSILKDDTEDGWGLEAGIMDFPPAPVPESELGQAHEQLRSARLKLFAFTDKLHEIRQPWGVSAYAALQALADLTSAKPGPRTKVKLELSDENHSSQEGRLHARELLIRAQESGLLQPALQQSPWKGVVLSTESDAVDTINRVGELAQEKLDTLSDYLEKVSEETGLVMPVSLSAWAEQLRMLQGVKDSLDIFVPEIFAHSAADMVIATASSQWRAARSLPMKAKERRALKRQAKDSLRPGVAVNDLHSELVKVQSYRDLWRQHALPGAWPRVPENLEEIKALTVEIMEQVEVLAPVLVQAGHSTDTKVADWRISYLIATIKALDKTSDQALRLPEQVSLLKELKSAGLEPLLDDLRKRRVPPDLVLAELDLAWWSAILTAIMREDPVFAGLDGQALHELSDRMRGLDLAQVESLNYPVGKAISQMVRAGIQQLPEQLEQLHFCLQGADSAGAQWDRYAPVLRKLRPIWALSPFLVSQLYGASSIDVLVLDHMDYLNLPQVIPLIARASQLVVLGDSKRGWVGFTKTAARVLPSLSLRCELGQLNEQVAEFLSRHGYEQTVVAVPSPRPASLVKLHMITGSETPLQRDQSLVISKAEINRVVELCLDHALNRPKESLAVVCLNPNAVARIRSALSVALVKVESAQSFFQRKSGEPFVVVDSFGTAGLRRDVVIVSLGMSKTPQGRVQLNFGPVSSASGVAHLVGCLEVVRRRLEIVSAFSASEVDLTKVVDPGGRMLLELLSAAGNPEGMERALTTPESFAAEPDRLLVDLAERLWKQGFTVVPRFGLPDGIQIPLAIGHADLPAELLVAVLTDDEKYAAELSLRRRERYWPARLESAGWRVVTCYTNEVFADPQAQVVRVQQAVHEALALRQRVLSRPVVVTPRLDVPEETESLGAQSLRAEKSEMSGCADTAELGVRADEGVQRGGDFDAEHQVCAESNRGGVLRLVSKERGPRPPVAKGLPLAAYGDDQLEEILEWICSDGLDRSEDEMVNEMRANLELSRRGAQVDAVLRHVVRRRNAAL